MLESERIEANFTSETKSNAPVDDNIIVTNNAGKSDTVFVTGLSDGDVVKVYDSASKGNLRGSATVAVSKTEATITISQLGTAAGSVYVSVTSTGMLESERTKTDFTAESKSNAADVDNITVTNNVGKADTVQVTGISDGDVVKVYDSSSKGNLLGSAAVTTYGTEATVTVTQLGTAAGSVYVSVTSVNQQESERTKTDFASEATSEAPDADNVIVNNNAGTPDTVYVAGLTAGDVVKVYNSAKGGIRLGSATVASSKTEATVTISQLGTAAGSVYVSVTGTGTLESGRTEANYTAEAKSAAPVADNITVTNNVGTSDTVYVTGLTVGDVVKAYDAAAKGTLLGSATVAAAKTDATITIAQLGSAAGSVYVSVTSTGKSESDRTQADYTVEAKSATPVAENIAVTNNAGASDTVYVSGLFASDVVKVYSVAQGGTQIGTATVESSKTDTIVTISQLGTGAGSVYVSVISEDKQESDRTKADYTAETKSTAPVADNITINNNVGTSDAVYVTGLTAGDTVRVYDKAQGGTQLGTDIVATVKTESTVTISQLGSAAGSVYLSVTSTGKLESELTKADYAAELTSAAPVADNITVSNNAGISDTVDVTGLAAADVVKVYAGAQGGNLLESATVTSNSTEATVTITQLGTAAGSIYVSVTSASKLESSRTKIDYTAESKSTAPAAGNITIVNNAGIAGTVKVTELVDDDIVKVYDSALGGTLLGTATVPAYNTEVTVSVSQLGASAGSVYVTVTSTGKLESDRTKADYSAKLLSTAPAAENVTVVNNAGIQDTVTVTGLEVNTVIKVYDSASGGNLLGSATESTGSMQATVTITQLGTSTGSVYVTVTSTGKTESERTKVDYSAELKSDPPQLGNITIVNNSGKSDTIKVAALGENDLVKVYNSASGGNLLGSASVSDSSMEVTITVAQLGASSGGVYVSVTSTGKTESDRVKADYLAESTVPDEGSITIVNNAGLPDTVTVTGLLGSDVIKVYNSASGGSLLGSVAVSSNSTQATVTITQLGTVAGNVYISVTSSGRTESGRTKADYTAEPSSTAPFVGYITVINNAGLSDAVTVTGLAASDIIKVYDAASGGTLLGSATVSNTSTKATVSITQLGTAAGSVFVSATSLGKTESGRTKTDYIAELSSIAPFVGYINVVNNSGTPDTVTVVGLAASDVIKVYDMASGGSLLGYATVPANSTQANVTITQLGIGTGSVYVSVTSLGRTESDRTKADFTAEA